jgi:acylphosphatase
MVTHKLVITGRVQGVGFRHYMTLQARALGVTGWVRNRTDGSVEAVVQGTPDAVQAMIAWAQRGPSQARVSNVTVADTEGDFESFITRSTE